MAALRPVEERDTKGNTIRVNPAVTYKQDPEIRKISGRNDYQMIDNPDYHPPITAQVQDGKILFFQGVPDNSATRRAAKEMKIDEVPEYIIDGIKRVPIKVREPRPTVYEVKLATIGDGSFEVTELDNDGQSVVVTPKEPELTRAAPSPSNEAAL